MKYSFSVLHERRKLLELLGMVVMGYKYDNKWFLLGF